MPEYNTDKGASDQGESKTNRSEGGPQELRSNAPKRALKSANEKLHQSTHHKNLIVRYGYNEYMAHHYANMKKVVLNPQSEELRGGIVRCQMEISHKGRNVWSCQRNMGLGWPFATLQTDCMKMGVQDKVQHQRFGQQV